SGEQARSSSAWRAGARWAGRLSPDNPIRDPPPGAPVRHLSRARRSGRSRGENSIGPCSAARIGRRALGPNLKVSAQKGRNSLHFDGCPGVLELLLHGGGLVLADVLLDWLRSAVDQILGLFQTETGELSDRLDHVDLRRAGFLQDHGELGLLLDLGRRGSAATTTRGRDRDRRGGHAPAVLQVLAELGDLEDRPGFKLSRELLEFGIF